MFSIPDEQESLAELQQGVERIKNQLGKIIVGQQQMVDLLITGLLAEGHILIEGVPGIAKTLVAKTLARCMDVPFSRIQFTPDLMPGDVIGTSIFNPKTLAFQFQKGPIFSSMVLVDEINRAPAKTQSALFEVMEERQITVDGQTFNLQEPFMIVATQNPIEQEGTYRLPEAQLDRFLFKINANYPTLEDEISILQLQQHHSANSLVAQLDPVISAAQILQVRQIVKQMVTEDKLVELVARIVVATRNNPFLYLGASPRASLAILKSSKAWAAIKGRSFVIPEDILEVVPSVLRHRIILSPEKEMEGVTVEDVIRQLLNRIEVPR